MTPPTDTTTSGTIIDSIDRTELRDRLAMADRHHYRSHLMSHSPLLPNADPRIHPTTARSRPVVQTSPRRLDEHGRLTARLQGELS